MRIEKKKVGLKNINTLDEKIKLQPGCYYVLLHRYSKSAYARWQCAFYYTYAII